MMLNRINIVLAVLLMIAALLLVTAQNRARRLNNFLIFSLEGSSVTNSCIFHNLSTNLKLPFILCDDQGAFFSKSPMNIS